ncbi:LytTR family transcriptional regulator [Flavobacterium sp. LaA7.5]|nr:LytTR family transcriptional regulator [Flavobacterium salilacus subsp. altitudinum]
MKNKGILLLATLFAVIGVIPKIIKNTPVDFGMTACYFIYVWFCIVVFYFINLWISNSEIKNPYGLKPVFSLVFGFAFLSIIHLVLFYFFPNRIIFFLNPKELAVGNILTISAFRSVIIQIIILTYFAFLKNQRENLVFKSEINHLNQYLEEVKNNSENKKQYKSTFVVRFQDKAIPVDVTEIAFFCLENGVIYQYLFSEKNYPQNATLESIEKEINPNLFYRANRQFLINRKAVVKIEQIENRKLKVYLAPAPPEEVIISKAKATAFIKWLEA